MWQFHSKFVFMVRQVLAVRPPTVTDNLRGRYHNISGNKKKITEALAQHVLMMNFHYITEKNITYSFLNYVKIFEIYSEFQKNVILVREAIPFFVIPKCFTKRHHHLPYNQLPRK